MAGVSQKIVMNLRRMLFKKLQKLPLSYFDTRTHGELMSRLTNDIDNVSNSISQSITQLMTGSIVIVGSARHDVRPQSAAYIGKPDYDPFGHAACPHDYKEDELVV